MYIYIYIYDVLIWFCWRNHYVHVLASGPASSMVFHRSSLQLMAACWGPAMSRQVMLVSLDTGLGPLITSCNNWCSALTCHFVDRTYRYFRLKHQLKLQSPAWPAHRICGWPGHEVITSYQISKYYIFIYTCICTDSYLCMCRVWVLDLFGCHISHMYIFKYIYSQQDP